ncbi:MAG: hypothetical protein QF780_02835 [Candidatus Marinimicrobia bacterium]|nr:hypothetical protein [Candidatus Neomarinimicrobiota bacterium]
MVKLILRKYFLRIIFCFYFIWGQSVEFEIKEYRPFPEDISSLGLKLTKFNWSIGNRFLLLDEVKNQLIDIDPSGRLSFPTGMGENSVYGQFIWMGVAPEGIRVVDRLENKILHFDHRLNSNQMIQIEPRLYPELAAISSWGVMYLYSQTYNTIFSFERSKINLIPFIDISKERLPSNCFVDMASNEDGDLALLSCSGTIYVFSKNGKIKLASPCELDNPKYIICLKDDWFIFNSDGIVVSMKTGIRYSIPSSSVPILDVESMNRSIAVLAQDHILILDVE